MEHSYSSGSASPDPDGTPASLSPDGIPALPDHDGTPASPGPMEHRMNIRPGEILLQQMPERGLAQQTSRLKKQCNILIHQGRLRQTLMGHQLRQTL